MTLQRPTSTRNSAGEAVTTWTDVGAIWAEMLPQGGREFERVSAVHAELSHRVRIRYRSDLVTTWRIKWGSRIFEILGSTNTEEANVELILECREHL